MSGYWKGLSQFSQVFRAFLLHLLLTTSLMDHLFWLRWFCILAEREMALKVSFLRLQVVWIINLKLKSHARQTPSSRRSRQIKLQNAPVAWPWGLRGLNQFTLLHVIPPNLVTFSAPPGTRGRVKGPKALGNRTR